jgi:hypothetical protein
MGAECRCRLKTALTLGIACKKRSAEWNFDLSVATRRTAQRGNNSIDVATQYRPLGISKDNNGYLAQGQVLLKPYVLVGCYEYLETCGLCGIKQSAVSERLPSAFDRLNNNMVLSA